jgi:hypothetical protein
MKRALIVVSCVILLAGTTIAQNDVEKVRKMRESTLKEIEYANKLLEETRGQTKASLQEVSIINEKLKRGSSIYLDWKLKLNWLARRLQGIRQKLTKYRQKLKG